LPAKVSAAQDYMKPLWLIDNPSQRKEVVREMVKVDSFSFKSIVIGGKKYGRDVLFFPDGSVKERKGGFWRFGSHTIKRREIEELVKAEPEVLIIGTGTNDRARLAPDAESYAKEAKLELVVLASWEAIGRLNQLIEEGKRAAALIHITC